MNLKKINLKNKSFTLIETLVSIGIFAVLTVVLTEIFVSSTQSQGRALYTQELMDQSSYALEYMDRILRMAKKDFTGTCTGTSYTNYYPASGSSDTIIFLDYNDKCHQFLLEGSQIKEKKSTDKYSSNFGASVEITSSAIKVNSLKFNIVGGAQNDLLQPKVTILIDAQSNTQKIDQVPRIRVQTSLSQRHLDIIE
jgi:type II secretory pathway pseudopilin PulG